MLPLKKLKSRISIWKGISSVLGKISNDYLNYWNWFYPPTILITISSHDRCQTPTRLHLYRLLASVELYRIFKLPAYDSMKHFFKESRCLFTWGFEVLVSYLTSRLVLIEIIQFDKSKQLNFCRINATLYTACMSAGSFLHAVQYHETPISRKHNWKR
jgi:hypothetical protein